MPQQIKPAEMPSDLRNSLWNEVSEWIFEKDLGRVCKAIWKLYYKAPIDKIPTITHVEVSFSPAWDKVRQVYFASEWNEVYDFLEFLMTLEHTLDLSRRLDRILVRELASYRVVNKTFVQITDQIEVDELENGITLGGIYSPAAIHLSTALARISDRISPDYRNSIKESISAVEAMAKILTGKPKATLDEALDILERSNALHKAARKGFGALYGYTNDAQGIRHALMDEPNLTQADAKYFLISCSAFVNYLKTLAIS